MTTIIYPDGHRELTNHTGHNLLIGVPPTIAMAFVGEVEGCHEESSYGVRRFTLRKIAHGTHWSRYYAPEDATENEILGWLVDGPKDYECEQCGWISRGSVPKRTLMAVMRSWWGEKKRKVIDE